MLFLYHFQYDFHNTLYHLACLTSKNPIDSDLANKAINHACYPATKALSKAQNCTILSA